MDNFLGVNVEVDLKYAKLLDTHTYTVDGIVYKQKVYRLKNHTIYVDTTVVPEVSLENLEKELDEAVKTENFEEAIILRNKIKRLKK
jgi:excinuclease UvrABC helicase subunit UvrB